MAIVMIGTAFFIGVYSSSSILAASVDAYNDAYSLRDVQIFSDYGFTEDDVKAVEALPDIRKAEGSKFVDVIAANDSDTYTTRIHSYDPDAEIDRFKLVEGRLPNKPGEALAEHGTPVTEVFPIGTKVKLSRPDGDLDSYLDRDEVTIVGLVDTPVYLNYSKENSTLRNTAIKTYLYIPEEDFMIDRILAIEAMSTKGTSFDSFSDDYEKYSEKVLHEVQDLADVRQNTQYEDIKQEALDSYHDGLREYRENEERFHHEITEAEKKLEESDKKLKDGYKQAVKARQEIMAGKQELARQEASGLKQLDDGQKQLDAGMRQVTDGLENLTGLDGQRDGLMQTYLSAETGLYDVQKALVILAYLPEQVSMSQAVDGLGIDAHELDELVPDWRDKTVADMKQVLQEAVQQAQQGIARINDGLVEMDHGVMTDDAMAWQAQQSDRIQRQQLSKECLEMAKENAVFTAARSFPASLRDWKLGYFTVFNGSLKEIEGLYDPQDPILYGTLEAFLAQAQDDLLVRMEQEPEELKWQAMYQGVRLFYTYAPQELKNMSMIAVQSVERLIPDLADKLDLDHNTTTFGILQDRAAQKVAVNTTLLVEKHDAVSNIDALLKERFSTHFNTMMAHLVATQDALSKKQEELYAGRSALESGIEEGKRRILSGEAELQTAQAQLAEGEAQLQVARTEFAKQKDEGQKKLAEAKIKLQDAKVRIDDMEAGKWTVLSRKQHYASVTFSQTVDQMAAIGKIFPVFFLMVAVLVCMTTMARTVDEQRTEIGVLRALGYSKGQCTAKYLLYAGIATVIGEIIGAVVGIFTFPIIIYNTWKMMYILPDILLVVDWKMIIMTDIAFLAVMLMTTWLTCRRDMNEVPARLLRPKSPKLGKNMLLEKITPLWKHISFTWKVTIRNLFRDKKRFILTVIGVAGCTALLVTGFGIRDSITGMVSVQYDELTKFDGMVELDDTVTNSEADSLKNDILQQTGVEYVDEIYGYNAETPDDDGNAVSVSVQIFKDDAQAAKAYDLRERKSKTPIHLGDDGVILSEKTAEILGLHAGDMMQIEDEEGRMMTVRIAAVTEMHINHYCFMSDAYYRKAAGHTPISRSILITGHDMKDLQKKLASTTGVRSVTFFASTLGAFNTMIDSLDIIVWTIIVSSMALAFVVLGNLINVNISERQREIATLKVLGFHDKEVQSYIYKENNVLTLCGALAGIPLGIWLHHTIMLTVEMDYVMFGREVSLFSILMSVVLTIVFGILVNIAMRRKLHAIEMVESLKSVE